MFQIFYCIKLTQSFWDLRNCGEPSLVLDDWVQQSYYCPMQNEKFFRDDLLPFAEVRYSQGSKRPFKPHLHRTLSIGAVDRGKVLYQVLEEKAVLLPGSLAIVSPDMLHSCNPLDEQGRSYYMLYLDIEWCFRVQQALWEIDTFVEPEKIRLDDEQLYQQYCSTMEQLMDRQVHLQEKEQLLFDLACSIFSVSVSSSHQKVEVSPDDSVEKLKTILAVDLQNDQPLETLAKKFAANPCTLIRRFKSTTGITPHAYRMNCRIEQAKELLRKGRDITDTALECGFFDQSHFHRHFKAMTSVTPQEYRVNFIQ